MAMEKTGPKKSDEVDRSNETDNGNIVIGFVAMLLFIPALSVFYVIQFVLSFWRNLKGREFSEETGRELDLLSGHDANWTASSPEEHPITAAIFVFRGKFNSETFAEKFSKDVVFSRDAGSRTKYARLLEYVVYVNGFYYWKREKKFDIKEHVNLHTGNPVNQDELRRCVEKLVNEPLPKQRSPWAIHIIPCVNEKKSKKDTDQKHALIFIYDHTLLDATRVSFLFTNELSDTAASFNQQGSSQKSQKTQDTLSNQFRKLCLLPLECLGHYFHAEVTSLARMRTTGLRVLGWSEKADFSVIEKIAEKTNSTPKDVILACVAESLKSFFKNSNMSVPAAVRIAWNVCKQNPLKPDFKGTTRTQIMLDLPLDKEHKLDAIKSINEFFTCTSKLSLLMEWNQWVIKKTGNTLPSSWFHWMMRTTEASLMANTISVSPSQQISVLGCPLEELAMIAPYRGKAGGSVTIATYNGEVRVGFSADSGIINDVTNVDIMMKDWKKHVDELAVELGVAK